MKILSNASVYLGANILNAAIPFFLLPILTRVLTPTEYGTVAMFEAAIACLAVLTGLSIHGAVGVHYYKEDQASFPQYVGVCLMILIGSTLVTLAVIALAAPAAAKFSGLGIHWLLFAVLVSAAQFLINIRLVIWQSANRVWRYGMFQIFQTVLNAALSLFLVLGLAWGGVGRMTGFGIAVIFFGFLALISLQTGGWIKWQWSREYFNDALRFGVPLVPHTLGGLAFTFADRFIITKNLGVNATGLYFVAVQLSMPLLMFGSSFNRAFVPWLYAKLAKKENHLAVVVSYIAIGGLLLSGMLYAVFVRVGLSYFVGEKYLHAQSIAIILIVGTSFQAAYYAVVNFIFYEKKTSYLSAITFVTGILYVAGAWAVAPNYGLEGIAKVFALTQGLFFLLVWIAAAIISPQPWLDFPSLQKALRSMTN